MLIIIYLILCIIVGSFGSKRNLGFVLTFILSLFITPLIMALLLLITGEKSRKTA